MSKKVICVDIAGYSSWAGIFDRKPAQPSIVIQNTNHAPPHYPPYGYPPHPPPPPYGYPPPRRPRYRPEDHDDGFQDEQPPRRPEYRQEGDGFQGGRPPPRRPRYRPEDYDDGVQDEQPPPRRSERPPAQDDDRPPPRRSERPTAQDDDRPPPRRPSPAQDDGSPPEQGPPAGAPESNEQAPAPRRRRRKTRTYGEWWQDMTRRKPVQTPDENDPQQQEMPRPDDMPPEAKPPPEMPAWPAAYAPQQAPQPLPEAKPQPDMPEWPYSQPPPPPDYFSVRPSAYTPQQAPDAMQDPGLPSAPSIEQESAILNQILEEVTRTEQKVDSISIWVERLRDALLDPEQRAPNPAGPEI